MKAAEVSRLAVDPNRGHPPLPTLVPGHAAVGGALRRARARVTAELAACCGVRLGRLVLVVKVSEVSVLPLDADLGPPLLLLPAPADAAVPRALRRR